MFFQSTLLRSAAIAALFLPALIPGVAAHGSVSEFVANGKSYDGPLPAGPTIASPVRQINNLEPIKNTSSSDMTCGYGASSSASEIAEVAAGSTVSFAWRSGNPGTPWPHTFGPVMQYMAACPGDASSCDASSLKFMKTDQKGLKPDGSGTWFQADINAGQPFTTTIPAGIPNGDYLLRHEIIALHNAMPGGAGAEFYVSCTQVRVTGGGNLRVAPSDLVSFPGAYKATDPGILIDIYEGLKTYPFPGPALITGAGSGSAPTKSTSSPPASRPTSKPHHGKCNLARHRSLRRRQAQANVAISSA